MRLHQIVLIETFVTFAAALPLNEQVEIVHTDVHNLSAVADVSSNSTEIVTKSEPFSCRSWGTWLSEISKRRDVRAGGVVLGAVLASTLWNMYPSAVDEYSSPPFTRETNCVFPRLKDEWAVAKRFPTGSFTDSGVSQNAGELFAVSNIGSDVNVATGFDSTAGKFWLVENPQTSSNLVNALPGILNIPGLNEIIAKMRRIGGVISLPALWNVYLSAGSAAAKHSSTGSFSVSDVSGKADTLLETVSSILPHTPTDSGAGVNLYLPAGVVSGTSLLPIETMPMGNTPLVSGGLIIKSISEFDAKLKGVGGVISILKHSPTVSLPVSDVSENANTLLGAVSSSLPQTTTDSSVNVNIPAEAVSGTSSLPMETIPIGNTPSVSSPLIIKGISEFNAKKGGIRGVISILKHSPTSSSDVLSNIPLHSGGLIFKGSNASDAKLRGIGGVISLPALSSVPQSAVPKQSLLPIETMPMDNTVSGVSETTVVPTTKPRAVYDNAITQIKTNSTSGIGKYILMNPT